MTTPNDLPPVGATVEDADGTSYVRLGSWNAQRDEIEYCWAREVESLGTKGLVEVLEPSGLAAVLTALWREQQARIAAEQARDSINTEAEMWRREVRERDKTVAQLHGEVTSALVERNYAHERAEQVEGELSHIDAVLARRPALDLPTRRQNIEKAIAVANRCDAAEARVAELEGVCMAADACVDALRDLAGDSHAEYIGAYDAVSVHPTWPPRGVDEARMADLEQERDRLKARVAKLEADAARYAYCRTGQWVRRSVSIGWDAATDSELMEERTFLEVPVLKGSDLSCHAWVDRAIDAARAEQAEVEPPRRPLVVGDNVCFDRAGGGPLEHGKVEALRTAVSAYNYVVRQVCIYELWYHETDVYLLDAEG